MKYAPLFLLALAACPSDDDGNPSRLYFAPDMVETRLKLAAEEPDPW
jgi:hypothetical protein